MSQGCSTYPSGFSSSLANRSAYSRVMWLRPARRRAMKDGTSTEPSDPPTHRHEVRITARVYPGTGGQIVIVSQAADTRPTGLCPLEHEILPKAWPSLSPAVQSRHHVPAEAWAMERRVASTDSTARAADTTINPQREKGEIASGGAGPAKADPCCVRCSQGPLGLLCALRASPFLYIGACGLVRTWQSHAHLGLARSSCTSTGVAGGGTSPPSLAPCDLSCPPGVRGSTALHTNPRAQGPCPLKISADALYMTIVPDIGGLEP